MRGLSDGDARTLSPDLSDRALSERAGLSGVRGGVCEENRGAVLVLYGSTGGADTAGETRMSHTPGPWSVQFVIDGAFQIMGTEQGDECVIAARNEFPDRHAEFAANARLIAAAPDLLAACKAASNAMFRVDLDTHDKLRAAIAKAEGR